jgi:hypothetical protein
MRGVLSLAAAVLVGLVFSGTASAHFQTGYYSHEGSGCSSRVDPITVVFYGSATGLRSQNHLRYHSGWDGDPDASQYFASHGICGPTSYETYNDCGTCTRFHIRMRKTYHDDATWGTTTTGTPHHEDWVWYCGHAVDKGGVNRGDGLQSGFDQGRSRIYSIFYNANGHGFGGTSNWGNTQEFQQCDGDWAGSHGSVYWFPIPYSTH